MHLCACVEICISYSSSVKIMPKQCVKSQVMYCSRVNEMSASLNHVSSPYTEGPDCLRCYYNCRGL